MSIIIYVRDWETILVYLHTYFFEKKKSCRSCTHVCDMANIVTFCMRFEQMPLPGPFSLLKIPKNSRFFFYCPVKQFTVLYMYILQHLSCIMYGVCTILTVKNGTYSYIQVENGFNSLVSSPL
jgi:hypothetical protein